VRATQKRTVKKQKNRWDFLRQRADECFVLRNSMHTLSGAAYGRDDDGGDAPESSRYESTEKCRTSNRRFWRRYWNAMKESNAQHSSC